ncbi:MAG: TetR/AcrR family transcriptional regulator [Acidimicrobiales bacterium]
MSLVPPSTKEQIVLTAEHLFAERGLEGVSLRQIGAAAGNGNHSVVQYHFGSKEQLVRAIFEYRLTHLDERRRILTAQRRPADLRSAVECYVLPILEQGEQEGSHYLSFVAMLQQHADQRLFEDTPEDLRASTRGFRDQIGLLLTAIPEPLRSHRITEAIAFSVHASAGRERAQAAGLSVLPFAVHVCDLLDGLVGFLEAPVSAAARAALAADTELIAVGELLTL